MDSPGRGSGLGGGMLVDDVVEAMCSGVWGIDQGSFRLTDDEDRCVVERKTLGRNARVRETKWYRKIDMVLLNDDATPTRDSQSAHFRPPKHGMTLTPQLCHTAISWHII
jgi:hypothetical protein